jgi:hypothetical protein
MNDRAAVFNNLEEHFSNWLKSRGIISANSHYIANLKAIGEPIRPHTHLGSPWFGMVELLTGIKPKVGVFGVTGLDIFLANFGTVLPLFYSMKQNKEEVKPFFPNCQIFDEIHAFLFSDSTGTRGDGGHTRSAFIRYCQFLSELETQINSTGSSAPQMNDNPRQSIYYGAPGTGKSFHTDKVIKDKKYSDTIRVTFHPDSDYASFVGCYKPTMTSQNILSAPIKLNIDQLAEQLKDEWTSADPGKGKVGTACLFVDKHKDYFDGPLGSIKVSELVRRAGLPEETYSRWLSNALVVAKNRPSSQNNDRRIVYEFVPQAFTKAYELAWRKMAECKEGEHPAPQFLVIEEINRGNCAQVFGDLFQLLDRHDNGFSQYPINADADLGAHLEKELSSVTADPATVARIDAMLAEAKTKATWADVVAGRKLVLPPNLYIWATMNTSDQSLFPMDSAFKRRWDWKYSKIKDEDKGYKIVVNDKEFPWWNFLKKINDVIRQVTQSADKQLGYFFVSLPKGETSIDAETFVNKVIFYLWNDVFRDCELDHDAFKTENEGEKDSESNTNAKRQLTFDDFLMDDGRVKEKTVTDFLGNLLKTNAGNSGTGETSSTPAGDSGSEAASPDTINP